MAQYPKIYLEQDPQCWAYVFRFQKPSVEFTLRKASLRKPFSSSQSFFSLRYFGTFKILSTCHPLLLHNPSPRCIPSSFGDPSAICNPSILFPLCALSALGHPLSQSTTISLVNPKSIREPSSLCHLSSLHDEPFLIFNCLFKYWDERSWFLNLKI